MRFRFLALALALFPSIALAQATIQLSGSNLLDNNGNKLAAGKIVLTVTDASGTPITYTPQGGSPSTAPYVDAVVNGVVQPVAGFPFQLLNTLTATPSGAVFHYQLESTDGSIVYLDVPKWNITSTTGGYSLDAFNALPGSVITGLGYPRSSCSPTAKYTPSDNPAGAEPWICSNLFRTDKSNQWTQNPSANPQCQMGQAIVSPRSGPPYCILPENAYAMPGQGLVNPSTTLPGPIRMDTVASGGANLPHVVTVISGDGIGNGVAMPEKQNTYVPGSPNTATVQCDEDWGMGRFDPRCTKYAGGVLGVAQGAAMQSFRDQLICYEALTGKHPHAYFPPLATISVGTDIFPTLTLPTGAIYESAGGWGFGTDATNFQATYNNHVAVEFDAGIASSTACSDGSIHTGGIGGGSEDGLSESGCGQGGCVNAPGDSGNYPFGGAGQVGIALNEFDGTIGARAGVYATHNGGDGVLCNGQDSHCHQAGGADNNEYFHFGLDAAGQNYQFSTGECHGDVVLGGLDNMNEGPFESYGTFATPGWEYGHVAGICWSGGLTNLGHYFVQIQDIGVIHMAGGNTQASADSGRIDAARGEGLLEMSNGLTTWNNPRIISACRFDGANDFLVNNVTTTTPGSGQTPNTYILTGSDGTSQISVVVGGGGTVTTNPAVRVHGRGMSNTPPTYTLAAGGTPATFTAVMKPVFALLHQGSGFPFTACNYITDQAGGTDTYISPLMVNNAFFGADHSTGDVSTPINSDYWIAPIGTSPNGDIKWDPNPTLLGAFWPGQAQRIIRADPGEPGGGIALSGSVLAIGSTGQHIHMTNSSPVRLTALTGGTIGEEIWIMGDGFTTMPYTFGNDSAVFGARTNTAHDLLLNAFQQYHFILSGGLDVGNPANLTEVYDSVFSDWEWVNHIPTASGLPPLEQQGTVDAMGEIRSHAIPALPALGVQAGGIPGPNGVGGSFAYSWRVWGTWGTQTWGTTSTFSQCLPLPGFINNPCFQTVHWTVPEGTTHLQVFREISSDGVATPGMLFEETFTVPSHSFDQGFPDSRQAPINSNIIGTANFNANVTGGPFECGSIPPVSAYPGVKGQRCEDPAGGFNYWADNDDHWKKTAATYSNF